MRSPEYGGTWVHWYIESTRAGVRWGAALPKTKEGPTRGGAGDSQAVQGRACDGKNVHTTGNEERKYYERIVGSVMMMVMMKIVVAMACSQWSWDVADE